MHEGNHEFPPELENSNKQNTAYSFQKIRLENKVFGAFGAK